MHDRREQARRDLEGGLNRFCNPIACLLDVLHRGPHVHDSRYMKTIYSTHRKFKFLRSTGNANVKSHPKTCAWVAP